MKLHEKKIKIDENLGRWFQVGLAQVSALAFFAFALVAVAKAEALPTESTSSEAHLPLAGRSALRLLVEDIRLSEEIEDINRGVLPGIDSLGKSSSTKHVKRSLRAQNP